MTHPAVALPTVTTCLRPGQSLHLYLDKRTTLFVAKGSIAVVAAPLWLGERMLTERTRASEGQAYKPAREGWTELVAEGDGSVELLQLTECREAIVKQQASRGSLTAALFQRMRALRGVS